MKKTTVELTVPASADFARCVRVLATDVATVAGLNIDEIEDVRMATEEGFIYAQAVSDAAVCVRFSYDEDCYEVEMGFSAAKTAEEELLEDQMTYVTLILDAVCDDYTIDAADGKLSIVKERGRDR